MLSIKKRVCVKSESLWIFIIHFSKLNFSNMWRQRGLVEAEPDQGPSGEIFLSQLWYLLYDLPWTLTIIWFGLMIFLILLDRTLSDSLLQFYFQHSFSLLCLRPLTSVCLPVSSLTCHVSLSAYIPNFSSMFPGMRIT